MGQLIDEGLIRGWGLSQVDVDVIDRAQCVTPLAVIQNIYSMVERDCEQAVIPYCLEHGIGFVPLSFLSPSCVIQASGGTAPCEGASWPV